MESGFSVFFREASLELIKGIDKKVKDIPESGLKEIVWHEVDASSTLGDGWSFMLSVCWKEDFSNYWLQLAAYHLPQPYKSSVLLHAGTKQEILTRLSKSDFAEILEDRMPKLYADLLDA